jgi:hypothetical protein
MPPPFADLTEIEYETTPRPNRYENATESCREGQSNTNVELDNRGEERDEALQIVEQWEMRRRTDLDVLRGMMLVLMTITHFPTRYGTWLSQPFGFVSAAEGFVFLSAYLVGAVYGEKAARDGVAAVRGAIWRRARVVWTCHAALLLFLFTVVANIAVHTNQNAIKNLLAFYLASPADALLAGFVMLYKPPLLDILPMYVVFLAISPAILACAFRRGWIFVTLTSAVLWLATQCGINELIYRAIATPAGVTVPFRHTGAFELGGWQLLWVLGMFFGCRGQAGECRRVWLSSAPVALVLVAIALVWRHAVGQAPFGNNASLDWLFGKWALGPLRLLNFFALAVAVTHFGPRVVQAWRPQALQMIGRASLPVFCVHVVASLVALALIGDAAAQKPLWMQGGLLLGVLAILYVTALCAERLRLTCAAERSRPSGEAVCRGEMPGRHRATWPHLARIRDREGTHPSAGPISPAHGHAQNNALARLLHGLIARRPGVRSTR